MKEKYYRLNKILSEKAVYNVIFGERSTGKTFACLELIIMNYLSGKGTGAYIRRWDEDLKGGKGANIFNNHLKIIEKLTKGKYNAIQYFQRNFYLIHRNEQGDRDLMDENPFCYTFSISMQEHYKSNSYPSITSIVFDEFLTRDAYIVDEFIEFQNLLSTIIRDRDDVVIFMLGNTINKFCPYFNEMGLTRVKRQKPGTIDVYDYGKSGLRVAVEYTGHGNGKKSDHYFAFDNENLRLRMITTGSWEMDIYPHLPYKYQEKEVIYRFFIIFDGTTLQCNVIQHEDDRFVFIHLKTSEVNARPNEIVYQTDADPRPNYRCRLNRPVTPLEREIVGLFQRDKVFYQSNDLGEVVRNYLLYCQKR